MENTKIILWKEPIFQTLTEFRARTIQSIISFVNNQWVFKIVVDPGYPDHSGIKVLFEGKGKSKSEALILAEEKYIQELK